MTLSDKRKLLSQLQFIHQRLTQTNQYFVNEFDIAKDSIISITNMFNKLQDEINAEQASLEESQNVKEA